VVTLGPRPADDVVVRSQSAAVVELSKTWQVGSTAVVSGIGES
jgi:hypothetical protein